MSITLTKRRTLADAVDARGLYRKRELVRNAQRTLAASPDSGDAAELSDSPDPFSPPPATSNTLSIPSPEANTRPSGVSCSRSALWSSVATPRDSQPAPADHATRAATGPRKRR